MTREDIAKLSDTKADECIAITLGWVKCIHCRDPESCDYWIPPGRDPLTDWQEHATHFPSYCSDLNAMHEAEETLSDEQHTLFRCALWDATKPRKDEPNEKQYNRRYTSATARQRVEAFLSTKQ